jgi:hypothetical protein
VVQYTSVAIEGIKELPPGWGKKFIYSVEDNNVVKKSEHKWYESWSPKLEEGK